MRDELAICRLHNFLAYSALFYPISLISTFPSTISNYFLVIVHQTLLEHPPFLGSQFYYNPRNRITTENKWLVTFDAACPLKKSLNTTKSFSAE